MQGRAPTLEQAEGATRTTRIVGKARTRRSSDGARAAEHHHASGMLTVLASSSGVGGVSFTGSATATASAVVSDIVHENQQECW